MSHIHETLQYIQQNLKAPKNQFNKFGGYKYRSCEDILEAVKPFLEETEATLILEDNILMVGNRFYIEAEASLSVKDDNGELSTVSVKAYAREDESKKSMDGAQITGSASSYARKYALNGLFCIDDNKDGDHINEVNDAVAEKINKVKAEPKSEPQPPQQYRRQGEPVVNNELDIAKRALTNSIKAHNINLEKFIMKFKPSEMDINAINEHIKKIESGEINADNV